MFCINCGALMNEDNMINEGEMICKGCSKLGPEIRNELLAMTEKENAGERDMPCGACGAEIVAASRFCSKCGAPVKQQSKTHQQV